MQLAAWRKMTPAERAAIADDLYRDALTIVEAGIQAQHGDVGPERHRFLLLERLHGHTYAQLATTVFPGAW